MMMKYVFHSANPGDLERKREEIDSRDSNESRKEQSSILDYYLNSTLT